MSFYVVRILNTIRVGIIEVVNAAQNQTDK